MNLLLFVFDDLFVLCLVWLKIKENNYWVGLLLPFCARAQAHVSVGFRVGALTTVSADVCMFKNGCFVIRSKVFLSCVLYSLGGGETRWRNKGVAHFMFHPQLQEQP